MRIFLKVFLAIFLIVVILEVKYFLTAGFVPKKIIYQASYRSDLEISSDFFEKNSSVLDQEFNYLNKGRQSYVFESKDKKYVIKFIRYHKYKNPFWAEILEYLKFLTPHKRVLLKERENRYQVALDSYKIAHEDLKDFTRVLYVHLNQTDFLKKIITVRDKLGVAHRIDLDKVAFVFQKKIKLFSKILLNMKKEKRKEDIEKMVNSFFDALTFKMKKDIINKDYPNIIRNCGYDEGNFIELDIGSFCKAQNKEEKRDFVLSYLKEFREFFEKNIPEVFPFFEKLERKKVKCLEN